jgi:competence ComEA-like helix-hairpin-helix protein
MGLYTRRQLVLLLAVLAASGIGLAVRHWRAAHPDVAARLERFDLDSHDQRSDRGGETDRAPDQPGTRSPSPAATSAAGDPLDLNRAAAGDLARLPGVGPALAARIVAARRAGTFTSVDDLARVRGLGRGRIERLRPLVSVTEELTGAFTGSAPESE